MDWWYLEKLIEFMGYLGMAYTGLLALAVVFQRFLVFPRHAIAKELAASGVSAPGLAETTIRTADGETLKAYWKAPAQDAPVIVTFHGNASVPQPYAERFASGPWAASGYGVLAVAYRGYPGSTGSPSEKGLLIDGLTACHYVRENAPDSPLVIHGHSMGSGVAVGVATVTECLALVLEAPFASVQQAAWDQHPFTPTFLLADKFRSDLRIGRVKADMVHILHGGKDKVIGPQHARKLAGLREDAVLTILEGEDHVSLLGVRDTDVERRISGWLEVKRQIAPRATGSESPAEMDPSLPAETTS